MKNSPEEYADELIDTYVRKFTNFKSIAIQCAIIDVENTLDALDNTCEFLPFDTNYFNEVLTILISKL